jgi:glutamate/tyrosine decarboxylase-like PLP-dependent enzyme
MTPEEFRRHGHALVEHEPRVRARRPALRRAPCAIGAATGTTGTTAVDPVGALADLADGLWLHVESAIAEHNLAIARRVNEGGKAYC